MICNLLFNMIRNCIYSDVLSTAKEIGHKLPAKRLLESKFILGWPSLCKYTSNTIIQREIKLPIVGNLRVFIYDLKDELRPN